MSRVKIRATQRRQLGQFDYEIPITFGGYVALHYPDPVEFHTGTLPASGGGPNYDPKKLQTDAQAFASELGLVEGDDLIT